MHENASKPKVAKYFKLLSNKVWSDVSNNLADKKSEENKKSKVAMDFKALI